MECIFDSCHPNVARDLTDLICSGDQNTVERHILCLKQNWKCERLKRRNLIWQYQRETRAVFQEADQTPHEPVQIASFSKASREGNQWNSQQCPSQRSPPCLAFSAAPCQLSPDKISATTLLEKRLSELHNTEQDFILNMNELWRRLQLFRDKVMSTSSGSSDSGLVRKRDVVKNVIKSGVATVLGILPVGKASADPYVRSSVDCGSRTMSENFSKRFLQWCPSVDWDEVVVLELMESVSELIKQHEKLMDDFMHVRGHPDEQSLPNIFINFAESVGGHHLMYHKAAERGLLMIQLRDADNVRDWHDLIVRPTQRILKYQLFVDELKRDSAALGRTREVEGFAAAAQRFREALRELNESTSTFVKDCKQTVNIILRNSPPLSPSVALLLSAQRRVLLHFDAEQVAHRPRLRGGDRVVLVGRQILAFEDAQGQRCLVIVDQDPALSFLEAIRLSSLSPSNAGPLRHCSAPVLEQIRRQQNRADAAGRGRLRAFELDQRYFLAEDVAVGDLLRLVGCADC